MIIIVVNSIDRFKVAEKQYPRGSEWRVWDLHIHTPASFHWTGAKFGDNLSKNNELVDEMIHVMNASEPAAFAIMDYWSFDGWIKLMDRLKDPEAPRLEKTVFPGIELRICTPTSVRLNAHAIFSNKIETQLLRDFRSTLKLEVTDRSLSDSSLADYARNTRNDKLKEFGTTQSELTENSDKALKVGSQIAEITRESYIAAIDAVPNGLALPFMPFSTSDGLESVNWKEHYAFVRTLFSLPPIFEARKYDQWAAFAGLKTDGNARWIEPFQDALDGKPRLAVSGSDAHRFVGKGGGDDQRGYGDFPSGKKTWIKANPTWEGLRQAIKEPANRSFIGLTPPKLERVAKNKTFYIDSISINKENAIASVPNWLDNCQIELNCDLVAIIGNKGSGKSALADIVALLGQSQQTLHYSFLTRDRFRGKAGEPARYFRGKLKWLAGADGDLLLSENPEPEQVELVKYIPQGRFKALCNDHVTGRSNEFEKELRSVIFAHVPTSEQMGASNFEDLIDRLEADFRTDLAENRKKLYSLNQQICSVERQLHPIAIKNVQEQLKLIEQQRNEHINSKPNEQPEPDDKLTIEQGNAKETIDRIDKWIDLGTRHAAELRSLERKLNAKLQAIVNLKAKLKRLEQSVHEFLSDSQYDAEQLWLSSSQLVSFSLKLDRLTIRETRYRRLLDKVAAGKNERLIREKQLNDLRSENAMRLAEPQQRYQSYLNDLKKWQDILLGIEGSSDQPETRNGILARLSHLSDLPRNLSELKDNRLSLVKSIFNAIEAQRTMREKLFEPLQTVIQGDILIPEEYQLNFQSKLDARPDKFSSQLFDLVKQSSGPLRGEDKSFEAVRDVFESNSLKTSLDAMRLASDLFDLLNLAARNIDQESYGLDEILRKDRETANVYDLIFGLSFIEPKYTLLFQETQIEQLSPGQRGALLLIFYLLVDKGRNPIVLDQPEGNLDNQTIVSLLVPVIEEAKKLRQIFMVTHNPNLAVVCDAEQIIEATFTRKGGPEIRYRSGAIESSIINEAVVNVLEGTKRAFENRGDKYH